MSKTLDERVYDFMHENGAVSLDDEEPKHRQVGQIRLDRLTEYITTECKKARDIGAREAIDMIASDMGWEESHDRYIEMWVNGEAELEKGQDEV